MSGELAKLGVWDLATFSQIKCMGCLAGLCHSTGFSVRRLVTQTVSVSEGLSLKPFQCQKACHSNRFTVGAWRGLSVGAWRGCGCLAGSVGACARFVASFFVVLFLLLLSISK